MISAKIKSSKLSIKHLVKFFKFFRLKPNQKIWW